MRALENILNDHQKVALLIGNGPNNKEKIFPSWKELLKSSGQRNINHPTLGLTNTEIFDLIELKSEIGYDVKHSVVDKLQFEDNFNIETHRRLMQFAHEKKVPVLTTNFDEAFERSIGAKKIHMDSSDFTRYYPWKTYYGLEELQIPTEGFGIWKIHGDVNYKDSIRLGLSDYIGSSEKARKLIHNGDDRLFKGKRQEYWKGNKTWLHIWFNLPIVIFGLRYDVDEVFLRWLLIERRRYLRIYNEPMDVYYLATNDPSPAVRNLMINLDVKIVEVSYQELYG
jgi:hypothetical protein